MKKAKNTKFFCQDCYIVFEILSDFDGREFKHKNCPGCADHTAVKPYNEPGETERKFWTPEEVELLDKYIAKEMHIYQLKILTGRNESSIYMKMNSIMKERGMPKRKNPKPWTDEHIELIDKLILGEITMKEAMKAMDRNYRSIENQKYKRIKELGLREEGERFNTWTKEELALTDRCIAGEITTRELATMINKNLKTVRSAVSRRKRKRLKEGETLGNV